jgi:hypothetical protein
VVKENTGLVSEMRCNFPLLILAIQISKVFIVIDLRQFHYPKSFPPSTDGRGIKGEDWDK